MTFYNLPNTDVKIEYDKDDNYLKIIDVPASAVVGATKEDGKAVVTVDWGSKVGSEAGEHTHTFNTSLTFCDVCGVDIKTLEALP